MAEFIIGIIAGGIVVSIIIGLVIWKSIKHFWNL